MQTTSISGLIEQVDMDESEKELILKQKEEPGGFLSQFIVTISDCENF